jgi:segregation and condensation protein A
VTPEVVASSRDAAPVFPSFRVVTPVFEGSLGELAHALRTGRLAPEVLDVLALVESYLEFYRELRSNPELATETLPGLARIVELKLRLLLPRPPHAPDEDEAVPSPVLETVLALEAFEEAIGFLRSRREARARVLPVRAPRPEYPRRTRPLAPKLGRLAELATRHRAVEYFELATERLTLPAAMVRLRDGLRRLRRAALPALMGARDWPSLVVGFSAMLELVKEGVVRAEQREPYGEIWLEASTEDAEGRDLVGSADAR